ncbi:MAG: hypothetical protein ACPHY8_04210 [Patescibacteria group bacterium]
MIDMAYDKAFNKLTDEERKALLVRDGTDTIANMYYNTEEMKQRFAQKDFSGVMM